MISRERERRVETPRVSSITWRVKGATVSARLMVIQILWPIPIRRIMVNVERGSHLLGQVDQVSILSIC